MTSSLVGSEMCIRDRAKRESPTGDKQRIHCVPIAGLRSTASSPATAPIPVSYTHLTLPTICSV
eukprot:3241936-Prorocentrum_lima.AAC.1